MKLRDRRFVANIDQLEGRQLLSTMFSIKDLGLASQVGNINASGQVVARALVYDPIRECVSISGPNGSSLLIPIDDANHTIEIDSSFGGSINDSGYATGTYTYPNFGAFLYKPGVGLEDIGSLAGSGELSYGMGINNSSIVTGYSFTKASGIHAFIYDHQMIDMGTLGGYSSHAFAINDSSQVVGSSNTTTGAIHAFFYNHGIMNDLGTLGGTYSAAYAINASGQVVGESTLTATDQVHAFLSDPNGGILHDLGLLTGSDSDIAFAVNDQGHVVGSADMINSPSHGFYYDGHSMMDLNSLIPTGSGFQIWYAKGINNSDQIAAYGIDASGQSHALLLTPIPHPTMTLSGGYLTIASRVASGDNVVVAIDPANGNVQVTADGVIEEFAGVNSIHYLSSTGGDDTFENHTNLTCIVSAYGSNNTFVGANGTTWYGFLVSDDNTIQDDGGVSIINGFNDTDHFSGTGTLIIL